MSKALWWHIHNSVSAARDWYTPRARACIAQNRIIWWWNPGTCTRSHGSGCGSSCRKSCNCAAFEIGSEVTKSMAMLGHFRRDTKMTKPLWRLPGSRHLPLALVPFPIPFEQHHGETSLKLRSMQSGIGQLLATWSLSRSHTLERQAQRPEGALVDRAHCVLIDISILALAVYEHIVNACKLPHRSFEGNSTRRTRRSSGKGALKEGRCDRKKNNPHPNLAFRAPQRKPQQKCGELVVFLCKLRRVTVYLALARTCIPKKTP